MYLLAEPMCLAGPAMRANIPHPDRSEFQFTSLGSVAEPVYLLRRRRASLPLLTRRLSVVAGVLSEMLLSGFWSLPGCMLV
jgi:hypothetical protein